MRKYIKKEKGYDLILPEELNNRDSKWVNKNLNIVSKTFYLNKDAPRRKEGATFKEKLDHMRHMCPDDTWPIPHETIFANNIFSPEGNKLSEVMDFGIMLRTEAYKNLAQQIHEFI